jgi:hypothetical protein
MRRRADCIPLSEPKITMRVKKRAAQRLPFQRAVDFPIAWD